MSNSCGLLNEMLASLPADDPTAVREMFIAELAEQCVCMRRCVPEIWGVIRVWFITWVWVVAKVWVLVRVRECDCDSVVNRHCGAGGAVHVHAQVPEISVVIRVWVFTRVWVVAMVWVMVGVGECVCGSTVYVHGGAGRAVHVHAQVCTWV